MKMRRNNRTCGSVRSSLTTLAGLATARSEAVVTMELRPSGRQARREVWACGSSMSGNPATRLMVTSPTQVNCEQASLTPQSLETSTGSNQKRYAVGCPNDTVGHTDKKTAGVVQGLNHHTLRNIDELNPPPRRDAAGVSVRAAVGVSGKGGWKKRTPSCNGRDRGCKDRPAARAGRLPTGGSSPRHFRTDEGGKSK